MSIAASCKLRAALLPLLGAACLVGSAGIARAASTFLYEGDLVHPACVHALVMHEVDRAPVTLSVSLRGCAQSLRSRIPFRFDGPVATFTNPELLGGGSFGYRPLRRLDNGIHVLAIRRTTPAGQVETSLAAVDFAERPVLSSGLVTRVQVLELLGQARLPEAQIKTLRSVGNEVRVEVRAGGETRTLRTVDFTELGKARRR
ncbi:MAG: hypothetical protein QNK04_29495 [Myxococcota bacterium]|nr:hypothetical protein [Myxococcota bacterium]